MPLKVFETIRSGIEAFYGGAAASIIKYDELARSQGGGRFTFARRIRTEGGDFAFFLRRSDIPFSDAERRFGVELASAFQVLYNGFKRNGHEAHYRTALLSSLMDIAIARYLRNEHHRAFWSIQRLIQLLKNLSYRRNEGVPATTGFVIYRKRLQVFRDACSGLDFSWNVFKPNLSITPEFFATPLTYRLVDGMGTYFTSNINMRVTGMIKFDSYGHCDAVERLYHANTFNLLQRAGRGAFAVDINFSSELEVMICPDKLFVWRRGSWSLFDPDVYKYFFGGSMDERELELLIMTLYSLSKIRHGTLVLVCDREKRFLDSLKKGSVGGHDSLSSMLINQVKDMKVSDLKNSGQLVRILSSDGLTVFNERGELLDTGLIIDTSMTPDLITGGGRTTAASAASLLGKVVKVSEDGPIQLYEKGKLVYMFG
ncbi:hypothetical protein [Geotalea sp. SG265]|uniref:hypothetical protein n=1 Tax=Geotalea sp. SG265 TaxID=2922867 RepID=UPI001FAF3001|nr:hypothetical protein [Geotalea sp. SG265]